MEERIARKKTAGKCLQIENADKIYFLTMLIFGTIVYFPMISQNLVNTYDGLWNGTYYAAQAWELSIGRWLWPVVDFVRFGVQMNPINALLMLSMTALSVTLLRGLFVKNDGALSYLAGMAFVSGAAVGVRLSYQYMSPIFGLALLLSVAAACCVAKTEHAAGCACGAVLLALSLGLYQADLACFCMILLAYLLKLLFQNAEQKTVHAHIVKSLGSAAAGMLLYWAVLHLILLLTGVHMADYNGADQISAGNILKKLPSALGQAYQIFGTYFFQNVYKHNMLQEYGFFAVVFAVMGIGLLCRFGKLIRDKNAEFALLGAAALLVLPLSCNVMMLISSGAVWRLQMSSGLNLFVPLLLLLLDGTCPARMERFVKAGRIAVLVLAFLVMYGNVYRMVMDQGAMQQGRDSLRVMSDRIVDDLTDLGYFDVAEQQSVVFVGRPSSNPAFVQGAVYESANRYAQMGDFWLGAECARMSWNGVFGTITRAPVMISDDDQYMALLEEETVAQMPIYPQEGYIRQVDGVLVVKVSEDYKVFED